jgi:UDP-2,3-diacylglucosamine hydrolase
VCGALRRLVGSGTEIDVVPGNRDFLLDRHFERASGARVRAAGLVGVMAGGTRVLFLHGDELATRDRGYQRLRAVLRSRLVTTLAPRVPSIATRALARRLRRASRKAVEAKSGDVKALQADAVRARARAHAAAVLVCGHAHRFRDERLAQGPRWIVVDAFGGARDTLEIQSADFAVRNRSGA